MQSRLIYFEYLIRKSAWKNMTFNNQICLENVFRINLLSNKNKGSNLAESFYVKQYSSKKRELYLCSISSDKFCIAILHVYHSFSSTRILIKFYQTFSLSKLCMNTSYTISRFSRTKLINRCF